MTIDRVLKNIMGDKYSKNDLFVPPSNTPAPLFTKSQQPPPPIIPIQQNISQPTMASFIPPSMPSFSPPPTIPNRSLGAPPPLPEHIEIPRLPEFKRPPI